MQKPSVNRAMFAGLALAAVLFVACGDNDPVTPPPPGIQPEIINAVDNFQFQVTAVKSYTGTLNYAWSNTGPAADVNQSCAVSAGTVTLTLIDGAGQEVYTKDLSQDGSFPSTTGTSGNWRIRVAMWGATGDLNFRVDKRTP